MQSIRDWSWNKDLCFVSHQWMTSCKGIQHWPSSSDVELSRGIVFFFRMFLERGFTHCLSCWFAEIWRISCCFFGCFFSENSSPKWAKRLQTSWVSIKGCLAGGAIEGTLIQDSESWYIMMIQPGLSQFFYDVDGSFKTWFEASSSSHGSSPVNHVFALPHILVWLKTRDIETINL